MYFMYYKPKLKSTASQQQNINKVQKNNDVKTILIVKLNLCLYRTLNKVFLVF